MLNNCITNALSNVWMGLFGDMYLMHIYSLALMKHSNLFCINHAHSLYCLSHFFFR